MFELEGVVPLSLKRSHQLFRHPLDLGLGKLDHVVAHIIAQGQGVRQQPRLFVLPKLQNFKLINK